MVKLARSPYRTAKRSPEWIKHKLNKQDEFVVVGWTDPGGTREHFGSLILGAHDKDGLRYAGEVGTGFNAAELERVMQMLRRLETPTCPLNPKPKILSAKGTPHWVRPQLVAQVRYTRNHRRRPASPSRLPRAPRRQDCRRKSRFRSAQGSQSSQGRAKVNNADPVSEARSTRSSNSSTSSRRRARTAGSSFPTATRSRSPIFTRSSGRRSRRPRAT